MKTYNNFNEMFSDNSGNMSLNIFNDANTPVLDYILSDIISTTKTYIIKTEGKGEAITDDVISDCLNASIEKQIRWFNYYNAKDLEKLIEELGGEHNLEPLARGAFENWISTEGYNNLYQTLNNWYLSDEYEADLNRISYDE